jgi:tRNA pseudouridine32 synthase/23S rRNA pseudouridine746 synthase
MSNKAAYHSKLKLILLAFPRPTCLYEDEHLLVLDKPEGLLSVPGKGPDKQDCLSHRALMHWPDALVVHRLDMATSGLLIFARSKEVQRRLGDAFAAREISKRYIATVYGDVEQAPDAAWHVVDAPLIADWERRPLQKVDLAFGKPSQTRFQRHSDQAGTPSRCTRIWLEPITGRSHQLRVHMSHIGLPIVGDALYAPAHVLALDKRLHLHAAELRFQHPCTNETLHIRSNAPNFCYPG